MSMVHLASDSSNTTITNLDEDMVAQNAIDIRIKSVRKILPTLFTIDETQKVHRESEELTTDGDGYWLLPVGSYEVVADHIITMGDDESGFVITRSTLNRNGVFVTTGNYDSGYKGSLAMCLHVTTGPMRIQKGTRIAQILLWKAEALKQYDGDYGFNASGEVKAMEAKYHK